PPQICRGGAYSAPCFIPLPPAEQPCQLLAPHEQHHCRQNDRRAIGQRRVRTVALREEHPPQHVQQREQPPEEHHQHQHDDHARVADDQATERGEGHVAKAEGDLRYRLTAPRVDRVQIDVAHQVDAHHHDLRDGVTRQRLYRLPPAAEKHLQQRDHKRGEHHHVQHQPVLDVDHSDKREDGNVKE